MSLLINHELTLRGAERGSRWNESGRARTPDDSTLERIPKARNAVADALSAAGLPDDQALAQGYLGESAASPTRSSAGIPEPIALGRIRAFGRPTGMVGSAKGIDDPAPPSALTLQSSAPGLSLNPPADGLAIIVLLMSGTAIAATLGARFRMAGAGAMALVLGAAAYAGGPTLLAGGLGLAAMGWRKNRPNGTQTTASQ